MLVEPAADAVSLVGRADPQVEPERPRIVLPGHLEQLCIAGDRPTYLDHITPQHMPAARERGVEVAYVGRAVVLEVGELFAGELGGHTGDSLVLAVAGIEAADMRGFAHRSIVDLQSAICNLQSAMALVYQKGGKR